MKRNSIKLFVFLLCIAAFLSACDTGGAGRTRRNRWPRSSRLRLSRIPRLWPAAGGKYFQEDFNGDLSNWSQLIVNGSNALKSGGNPVMAPSSLWQDDRRRH